MFLTQTGSSELSNRSPNGPDGEPLVEQRPPSTQKK